MRRREFLQAAAAGVTGAAAFGYSGVSRAAEPARLRRVTVEGDARARGESHGEQLRDEVRGILELWQGFISQISGMEPGDFVAGFLGETKFVTATRKYVPDYMVELEGIAAAAGVDLDTLTAYNFTDEQGWWLRNKMAGLPVPEMDMCTALGFETSKAGYPIIGQNMDIASGSEGFEFLLDLRYPDGRQTMAFSVAGLAAVVGINNAPLGIVNNSLRQLDVNGAGCPVNVIVRGILDQQSLADAKRFILETPHASGQNYLIGSPEGVASFEAGGAKVVEWTAPEFPGLVYHTNHPYVNDTTGTYEQLVAAEPSMQTSPSTFARAEVVTRRLASLDEPVDPAWLQSLLSSRENGELPVCRPHNANDPGATFTAASMVMEFGEEPLLHITAGPPSENPYTTFRFG